MDYDIAIIGGGPGGYVAAIYGARRNAKVALIEKNELGGTCLNRGCIPTKALAKSAGMINEIKSARRFGISTGEVKVNWTDVQQNQRSIVNYLGKGVEGLLKANGVEIYKGHGKIINNNTIEIESAEGQKHINARKIIISTGSAPAIIPVPGSDLENVITSDEALALEELPESMLIVGGGVIGIELGYIFNALGTKVTIVEMLPQILPRQDEQVVKEFRSILESQGIVIHTNTVIKSISKNGSHLCTDFQTKEGIKTVVTDKVLMATGRKPVIPSVDGHVLKTSKTGIYVDDYNQTNIENIYAIGDVTGRHMLAHVASHQGIAAVKNALGDSCKMDYKVIPSCIYTQPEMASVGLTESEARGKYKDQIKVGFFSLSDSGKALTSGETQGFVKIITDAKLNEILGVHILGQNATELVAEAALAIKMECTAEELADTIHAHPTLSEALAEACFDILKLPIHKL